MHVSISCCTIRNYQEIGNYHTIGNCYEKKTDHNILIVKVVVNFSDNLQNILIFPLFKYQDSS